VAEEVEDKSRREKEGTSERIENEEGDLSSVSINAPSEIRFVSPRHVS